LKKKVKFHTLISASHSTPVGGGNAPKLGLPTAIKSHYKKKKKL